MREVILCFILIACVAVATNAQESTGQANGHSFEKPNWKLLRGAKELSVEFGFAPMQPTFLSGREEYNTDGRKFVIGSFRWGRVIGTTRGVTYEYLFEAMPVVFAISNEVKKPAAKKEEESYTVRDNTYGAAIHPAGFRFVFLPKHRLKPFVQTSAGFVFTRKPVPVPESPNYNFSGDFGGGLMYSLDKFRTINFGYRYFHISNMNIGEINPGYNANVFYIGYSSFYK